MKLLAIKYMFPLMLAGTALAGAPDTVCRTFRLRGVECGGCVYMVEQSLRETRGIVSAQVTQGVECRATVTYSPLAVGEQGVAQAVRDAHSLHGEPYAAQLKLNVRGYAAHADSVRALFRRWEDAVRVEVLNFEKGELLLSFLPLKGGGASPVSPGWSLALWAEAAGAGLPEGVTWELPVE
jgi:copper chaperone CopZ